MSEFSIVVEPNQSIFTSQFFTGWETYLPALGLPLPKFNTTFKDLLSYLGVISEVMSEGYVGLSTVLGDYAIPMDATNLALCQTSYWAICNRQTAEHYFPTEELTDALQQTDMQWIDVDHWRKQPDFFSIKLPKRNMFKLTIGGAKLSVDDIAVMRITIPELRSHFVRQHNEVVTDTTQVFFWLCQSRDETNQGLQNSSFGSIILHEHTKLVDLLKQLVDFAVQCDASWTKQVEENDLIGWVTEKKKYLEGRYAQDHADYVLDTLRTRRDNIEDRYQEYRDLVEFLLKFVTFTSVDGFEKQRIIPPGMKPGKTSQKAKAIQAKIFARWGWRYKVPLPLPHYPDQQGGGTHASPVRHLVRGFFRQQHYGPKNSLTKTIWIMPFWRGTIQLADKEE